jgi:hypothetical protein
MSGECRGAAQMVRAGGFFFCVSLLALRIRCVSAEYLIIS